MINQAVVRPRLRHEQINIGNSQSIDKVLIIVFILNEIIKMSSRQRN